MRSFFGIMACCAALAGFPNDISAADEEEPKRDDDRLKLTQIDPDAGPIHRATSWLGKRVVSQTGQALGQVEDVALDLEESHVSLIVVKPAGDAAQGRLYFPPGVLARHTDDALQLKKSDVSLDKMPRLRTGLSAAEVTRLWAAGVYTFFGAEPYWKQRQLASTWGPGTKYDKLYNVNNMTTIEGKIESIDNIAPLPGMAVGTQLTVATSAGNKIVLVAPVSYLSRQDVSFRKGDEIAVTGSQITLNDRPVVAAATLKSGDRTLTLRNKDGQVAWNWSDQDDAYGFSLLTSLIGTPVHNLKGEELGHIEDFAVNPTSGRIAYAGVACTCFPTAAGKLFPIPLSAFVVRPQAKIWTLELPEDVLANTPTFQKDRWPEAIDRGWVEYVHVRYGRSTLGGVRSEPHGKPEAK